MIQRNYAKSFTGFKSRILAKITGFTILQFLNKFVYHQPVGRVKHTLANYSANRFLIKILYEKKTYLTVAP